MPAGNRQAGAEVASRFTYVPDDAGLGSDVYAASIDFHSLALVAGTKYIETPYKKADRPDQE